MLQIFLSLLTRLQRRSTPMRTVDDEEAEAWRRDPLFHPDVAAMSERELADLPFGADRLRNV